MPDAPHSDPVPPRRTEPPRRSRALERRARAQVRLQRRRVIVSAVAVVALVLAGSGLIDRWADASGDGTAITPDPVVTPPPPTRPPPELEPEPEPTPSPTEPPVVLALTGEFPDSGSGQVTIADGEGDEAGEAGEFRRYRVAVEETIDESLIEFTDLVEETLAADQGWTAGGEYRFQRVSEGHDFTIYLVTSQTAAQMCAAGGLVVIASGLPDGGVSCRLGGQVIINYSRWRLSVPQFVEAEVPLSVYRQMVVNHEIGHELGYGHFGCPGSGEPAPVMQQQSIELDGCEANPWPYLDDRLHTGPPAA